jgi:hypothetical protein
MPIALQILLLCIVGSTYCTAQQSSSLVQLHDLTHADEVYNQAFDIIIKEVKQLSITDYKQLCSPKPSVSTDENWIFSIRDSAYCRKPLVHIYTLRSNASVRYFEQKDSLFASITAAEIIDAGSLDSTLFDMKFPLVKSPTVPKYTWLSLSFSPLYANDSTIWLGFSLVDSVYGASFYGNPCHGLFKMKYCEQGQIHFEKMYLSSSYAELNHRPVKLLFDHAKSAEAHKAVYKEPQMETSPKATNSSYITVNIGSAKCE